MGIEHKEVAGQRQSFYVLRILENGMKIMIPMNKVGSVGLREIIGEELEPLCAREGLGWEAGTPRPLNSA